ncbi:thermonuclease family protein [Desulfocurvus sp. DL9XJH121]
MKHRIYVTITLLLLLGLPAHAEEAHFLKAIDGDSILVELHGVHTEVRLLGVDAPEYDQDPWGDKAKDFVRAFCLRGLLDLEYDLDKHDRYHRLLAYVWSNGEMLNLELARAGLAFPVYYKPNKKHLDALKAANAEAKAAACGFYAPGAEVVFPAKWRKEKR